MVYNTCATLSYGNVSHDEVELSSKSPTTSKNNHQVPQNKYHRPKGVPNIRESSKKAPRRYGNIPDIHWRSIPMNHLRLHPYFDALPIDVVHQLDCLEDVRNFRQDSWQWDAFVLLERIGVHGREPWSSGYG